jgi:hypothetical protein
LDCECGEQLAQVDLLECERLKDVETEHVSPRTVQRYREMMS